MTSCTITKKPSLLIRLVQKYNPKPIKDASVRYDSMVNKWALINPETYEPIQHFELAVLKNVTFSNAEPKQASMNVCIDIGSGKIGIAKGDLYLHKTSDNVLGGKNFSFHNGAFVDGISNKPLTTASEITLMSDRRAIYHD